MNTTQQIIKIFAIALAITIITVILSVGLHIITALIGLSNPYNTGEKYDFTQEYQDIKSIDIDVAAASITLKRGDSFKVEATYMDDTFTVKEKDGILQIREDGFRSMLKSSHSIKMVIFIPYTITLDNLKINSGAGAITIEEIDASKTDIDQGAGSLKINHSTLGDTKMEGGAGELIITDSTMHNLDLDAGVGRVEIGSTLTGTSKIDCGVGELNVTLLHEEDYALTIDKGIGSITVNGIKEKSNYVHGNGDNTVKISGGIGSITVKFK